MYSQEALTCRMWPEAREEEGGGLPEDWRKGQLVASHSSAVVGPCSPPRYTGYSPIPLTRQAPSWITHSQYLEL